MIDLPPLNRTTALRLLEQVVAEYGADYRYGGNDEHPICTYTRNGQPSCLIGHVLHRHGISIADLIGLDETFIVPDIDRVWRDNPDWMSAAAAAVLDVAQAAQDSGHPWGVALRDARLKHQQLAGREESR